MHARLLLVALVSLAAVSLTDVAAQSVIPNGAFLGDNDGQVWMVLNGQRLAVPMWGASATTLAAIPVSDRWVTVDGTGAMVPGDRPTWALGAAPTAPASSVQPRTVQGKGAQRTAPFTLEGGTYIVRWSGDRGPRSGSNLILALRSTDDTYRILLANTIIENNERGQSGETWLYNVKPGSYYLAVDAPILADWSVTFTPQ